MCNVICSECGSVCEETVKELTEIGWTKEDGWKCRDCDSKAALMIIEDKIVIFENLPNVDVPF